MPSETHLTDEDLVLIYYGEQERDVHLADCPECNARLAALAADLPQVTDQLPVPERHAEYGRWVWFRLRPHLAPRRNGRRAAIAAGVAALILGAFAAGRYSARPAAPEVIAHTGTPRVMRAALSEHLERSQLLLREIANAPEEDAWDFTGEQQRAESLLTPNRLYRQAADSAGDRDTAEVLEDLEQILLEVAHAPAQVSAGEIKEIRERIRRQGIVFRVKVEEVQQEILEQ